MKNELHLIIVWQNASGHFNKILQTIDEQFVIKRVYKIEWSENKFIDNLTRFYSHSQYHLNKRKIKKLFKGKAKHCGTGPFHLIIFEDINPSYQKRDTSSGNRKVNINVFDIKARFREITGGGHKIHGTDNSLETNKDLSLLLGVNEKDFIEQNSGLWNREIVSIERNVTGLNGFNSIEEFFYVLNQTANYIILRNFDDFPENYILEKHGDIDLLTDNLNLLVYTTGAKKVFNKRYRVHYKLLISHQEVYFDFRYVGDNYFDIKWQKQLLKNKILRKDLFFIPDATNHFYSLLYHALIHKMKLSDEYYVKLKKLASDLNIYFEQISTGGLPFQALEVLDGFMKKNDYRYVYPKDFSVIFNLKLKVKADGSMPIRTIRRYLYNKLVFKLFLSKKLERL